MNMSSKQPQKKQEQNRSGVKSGGNNMGGMRQQQYIPMQSNQMPQSRMPQPQQGHQNFIHITQIPTNQPIFVPQPHGQIFKVQPNFQQFPQAYQPSHQFSAPQPAVYPFYPYPGAAVAGNAGGAQNYHQPPLSYYQNASQATGPPIVQRSSYVPHPAPIVQPQTLSHNVQAQQTSTPQQTPTLPPQTEQTAPPPRKKKLIQIIDPNSGELVVTGPSPAPRASSTSPQPSAEAVSETEEVSVVSDEEEPTSHTPQTPPPPSPTEVETEISKRSKAKVDFYQKITSVADEKKDDKEKGSFSSSAYPTWRRERISSGARQKSSTTSSNSSTSTRSKPHNHSQNHDSFYILGGRSSTTPESQPVPELSSEEGGVSSTPPLTSPPSSSPPQIHSSVNEEGGGEVNKELDISLVSNTSLAAYIEDSPKQPTPVFISPPSSSLPPPPKYTAEEEEEEEVGELSKALEKLDTNGDERQGSVETENSPPQSALGEEKGESELVNGGDFIEGRGHYELDEVEDMEVDEVDDEEGVLEEGEIVENEEEVEEGGEEEVGKEKKRIIFTRDQLLQYKLSKVDSDLISRLPEEVLKRNIAGLSSGALIPRRGSKKQRNAYPHRNGRGGSSIHGTLIITNKLQKKPNEGQGVESRSREVLEEKKSFTDLEQKGSVSLRDGEIIEEFENDDFKWSKNVPKDEKFFF